MAGSDAAALGVGLASAGTGDAGADAPRASRSDEVHATGKTLKRQAQSRRT